MRYYAVKLTEAQEPVGISSAATRACMCCGLVVSGMGGGGKYLCQACLDKMHNGDMAAALYLLEKQNAA